MIFDDKNNKFFYRRASIIVLFILFVLSPLYSQPSPGGTGLYIPINNIVWIFAFLLIGLGTGKILSAGAIYWSTGFNIYLFLIGLVVFAGYVVGVVDSTAWVFRVGALFSGFLFFLMLCQLRVRSGRSDSLLLLIALAGFLYSFIFLIGVISSSYTLIFSQTNLLATALSTSALVSVFLKDVSDTFSGVRRWKIFFCVVIFLSSVVAFNLGSRVGILGLLFGCVCIGLYFVLGGGRRKDFILSVSLVLLAAMTVGFFGSGWDRAQDKFGSLEDGSDARIYIYSAAFRIAIDEPILGGGFGSFEKNMASMLSSDNQALIGSGEPLYKLGESPLTHPHNEVLYWAAEAGLLGLIISVVFSLFILFCLLSKGWRSGFSSLGMIFPLLLHSLVELPFYLSAWHWLIFLSILALSLNFNNFKLVRLTQPFRILFGLLICPALAVIIFFHINTLRSLDLMSSYVHGGREEPEDLAAPSRNYYLSEFVELMVVRHMFYEDVATGARSFFPIFIQVAESYLKTHSNPIVYDDLVYAYFLMGRHDDCEELLQAGLSIYPDHGGLLRRKCIGREENPGSQGLGQQ